MKHFWEIAFLALLLYIVLHLSFCCKKGDHTGETIFRTDTIEKPYEVTRTITKFNEKVVARRDTVRIKEVLNLSVEEKDSLLSEFLGVKVFTREFQDSILLAFITDTVQGNHITGTHFTYQLKKPFVTILPERRRNKFFIGGGFMGDAHSIYIYPELMFLTKKDTYLSLKYDPINKLYGVSGGLKLGK